MNFERASASVFNFQMWQRKHSSQALVAAEAVDALGEVLGYDAQRLQRLRRHRHRRRVVGAGCGGRRRWLPGARAARAGEGDLLSEASDPLCDLGCKVEKTCNQFFSEQLETWITITIREHQHTLMI